MVRALDFGMSNDSSSVPADCYDFDYLCVAKFKADADIGG